MENTHATIGSLQIFDYIHVVYRIIAYGPGVEPVGPIVGSPVSFTVETVAAGRGL